MKKLAAIAFMVFLGGTLSEAAPPAGKPARTLPTDVVRPNPYQRLNLFGNLDKPRFELKDKDWPAKPGEASICLWKDDAVAAASMGIDDNEAYNLPWWMGMCKKYDLKPTWWLATAAVNGPHPNGGTWEGWKKIVAAGYEVASHSVDHLNHNAPAWDDMEVQYGDSKKAIEEHLVVRCLTLAYPGGKGDEKNDPAVAAKYYIAARGVAGGINTANAIDYLSVCGMSSFPVHEEKWPSVSLHMVFQNERGNKGWRGWWVGFFHWIPENDPKEVADCEQRFAYIRDKVKSGELWLGFFSEVARYGQERDTARLTVKSANADKIVLDLTDEMDDGLFDFPLTVKVRLADAWKSAAATQNGKAVRCKVIEHQQAKFALVQVVPDRGEVVISAASSPLNAADCRLQQQAQDALAVARKTLAFVEKDSKRPALVAELRQLEDRFGQSTADSNVDWSALGEKAKLLQRKIIFSHPLLAFDDLMFIERDILATAPGYKPTTKEGPYYDGVQAMDQCFGHNARKGGGLYLLKRWRSDSSERVNLVAGLRVPSGTNCGMLLSEGAFVSPALSYDGKTVLFGWASGGHEKWKPENRFNLFRVNVDGSGLARLTDGDFDNFDPCWLPDGRIVFISTRRGGFGRCHPRPVPTYTLFSMNSDGSDIRCLSYHETNEWQPSVDHNGKLLYTRWDYIDRDAMIAIHPWTCFPDGRDPRAIHGNYPLPLTTHDWLCLARRPFSETAVRARSPGHSEFAELHRRCHSAPQPELRIVGADRSQRQGRRPDVAVEATHAGRQVSRD